MKGLWKLSVIGIFAMLFFSCKTPVETIEILKAKSITDKKLYKKISQNSPDFTTFQIKKANILLEINDKKKRFNASVRIQKNEKIWMSITTFAGLEVARIILLQDSVKFINRLRKEYFFGDYEYINDLFNLELNFETIQCILTNRLFEYDSNNDKPFVRKFKGKPAGTHYTFQYSKQKRKIRRKIRKDKEEKLLKLGNVIFQTFYIHPGFFQITKVNVEEIIAERKLTINYGDFDLIEERNFPKSLNLFIIGPNHNLSCSFKFKKIKFDNTLNFPFSVSKKYKPAKQ